MAYQNEHYIQHQNCYCERCIKITGSRVEDSAVRMVVFDATANGSYQVYLCAGCIREIAYLLGCEVLHTSQAFKFNRNEMISKLGANTEKMSANDLRDRMSQYEKELRAIFKDGLEFKKGYTDRNKFVLDIRGTMKNILSSVEDYLNKTIK